MLATSIAMSTSLDPSVLAPHAEAWTMARFGGVRGVTLGPIESLRHPGRGYGTEASGRALDEAVAMGATWVSITPFGRVADLTPRGIDLTFEAPFDDNRAAVMRVARQAHDRGLRVLVVPHLWVESGEWRALIDPKDDAGWDKWAHDYARFVLAWAAVARDAKVDMLSVGVELRSWVTTSRVGSMIDIIHDVRAVYPGLLTYSANWDDVGDTLLWGELDLVGINAFYPLTDKKGASLPVLLSGGRRVASEVEALSRELRKPVVLTEIGYTTRADPAVEPWIWPDGMQNVVIDQEAQAAAYTAIIAPFIDAPWCAGFFVWRLYADPDDVSQEPEFGFSPRGKLAELILRDAFGARFAADGPALPGDVAGRHRARIPGIYGWDESPPLLP
jgi:hypothetical protein